MTLNDPKGAQMALNEPTGAQRREPADSWWRMDCVGCDIPAGRAPTCGQCRSTRAASRRPCRGCLLWGKGDKEFMWLSWWWGGGGKRGRKGWVCLWGMYVVCVVPHKLRPGGHGVDASCEGRGGGGEEFMWIRWWWGGVSKARNACNCNDDYDYEWEGMVE